MNDQGGVDDNRPAPPNAIAVRQMNFRNVGPLRNIYASTDGHYYLQNKKKNSIT